MTLPTANPTSPPLPVQQFSYTGKTFELIRILYGNFIFTVLTLGVYTFWGKTKLRRFLWSHIKFLNEPFSYTGTGKELFRGYIKFSMMFILPSIAFSIASEVITSKTSFTYLAHIGNIGIFFTLYVVSMYAKFSGMRYRLGRTNWRGIRFELRGDRWAFVRLKLKIALFTLLTLGYYKPFGDVAILQFVVNKMYLGNQAFRYNGRVEDLQKPYYLCWLLIIPTLGFSMVWYRAYYYGHLAKYTRWGAMEFRCKVTGRELFGLDITNLLLIAVTFGLAYPLTYNRRAKFFRDHVKFRGTLDYDTLLQAQKSAGGEGAEIYLGADDIGL